LFSSCVHHLLNYYVYFARLKSHQFFAFPLFSLSNKKVYEKMILAKLKGSGIRESSVFPILMKKQNSHLSSLMNPIILIHDFFAIIKSLSIFKPEAIICFYLGDAIPLVILKKLFGYSLSVVAMGSDVNLQNSMLDRFRRSIIFRNSNLIFALSMALRDKIEAESGYKAIVMPSGVDVSVFKNFPIDSDLRKQLGVEKDFVIMTACHLVKVKGLDVLLGSLKILQNRKKRRIKLLVVGDGPERVSLMNLASRLEIDQHVVFLGYKTQEEMIQLYNLSDVFVLASYSEGLPFVVLEAMASGCICISTSVGDVPRIISEGKNGFIVPSGDPKAISEKIEKVLSLSEEERVMFRKNARSTVEERYEFRKLTRNMIECIVAHSVNLTKENHSERIA
jgi:glycosyltransferase involved in cell wall biosynthesis